MGKPLIAVPALILLLKFLIGIGPSLKTGDWLSGCLSIAQLGVDLVYLSVGLLVGDAMRRRIVDEVFVGDFVMSLCLLLVLLAVTYWIIGHARKVARERLAGVYKVPTLRVLLMADLVNRMIDAVSRLRPFTKSTPPLWSGAAAVGLNVTLGASAFGWTVSRILSTR